MVYPITRKIFFPILRSFIKKTEGLSNIPKEGSFIIACKHISALDGYFLAAVLVPHLNKKIHFIANTRKWGWWWEKIVSQKWAACIPFDPSHRQHCLEMAMALVEEGQTVGIFPEGYLVEYGQNHHLARTGVARLALGTKVPIIPVGFTYNITVRNDLPVLYQYGKSIKNLFLNPRSLEINIGEPFELKKYYNNDITGELLRQATTEVMDKIEALSYINNINIK